MTHSTLWIIAHTYIREILECDFVRACFELEHRQVLLAQVLQARAQHYITLSCKSKISKRHTSQHRDQRHSNMPILAYTQDKRTRFYLDERHVDVSCVLDLVATYRSNEHIVRNHVEKMLMLMRVHQQLAHCRSHAPASAAESAAPARKATCSARPAPPPSRARAPPRDPRRARPRSAPPTTPSSIRALFLSFWLTRNFIFHNFLLVRYHFSQSEVLSTLLSNQRPEICIFEPKMKMHDECSHTTTAIQHANDKLLSLSSLLLHLHTTVCVVNKLSYCCLEAAVLSSFSNATSLIGRLRWRATFSFSGASSRLIERLLASRKATSMLCE